MSSAKRVPSVPEYDEDWIELAGWFEDLADRIRTLVDADQRQINIWFDLRPDAQLAAVITNGFALSGPAVRRP